MVEQDFYSYLVKVANEIKVSLPLENYIGRVVSLKKLSRYSNLSKGLCPFHKEKTPSFFIFPSNDGNDSFYCFGCHERGDIFNFLELSEGMGFTDAVQYLAGELGIEFNPPQNKLKNSKQDDKKFLERIASYFWETLQQEQSSRITLSKKFLFQTKGLSLDTIDKFKIGFCPGGWLSEMIALVEPEQKILGLQKLEKLGLLTKSGHFLLENKIVFPIKNARGEVVSLAGRIIPGDTIEPKYLNGANSDIFRKSEHLFGLGEKITREEILKKKEIYIVEGYFDVIKLHEIGIYNVAACMGTNLSDEHFKLFSQFKVKTVHLCLDADKGGFESVERIIEERVLTDNPSEIEIKVVTLPDGSDPDELSRGEWDEVVANSQNIIDYITKKFIGQVNSSSSELNEFLAKIFRLIANLNNSISREFYLTQIGRKLKVTKATITRQYNEYISGNQIKEAKNKFDVLDNKLLTQSQIYSEFAIKLLSLMVRYGMTNLDPKQIISKEGVTLSLFDFQGQPSFIRKLFLAINGLIANQKTFVTEDLVNLGLSGDKLETLLNLTSSDIYTSQEGLINQLNFVYNKMRVIQIEEIRANIIQTLSEIEDENEVADLLDIVERLSEVLPELE